MIYDNNDYYRCLNI